MNIEGQWVGDITGAHTGIGILNIEKGNPSLGHFFIKQYDIAAPAYRMDLPFSINGDSISGATGNPLLFDHGQQQLLNLDQFKQRNPQFAELTFSQSYQIRAKISGDTMEGTWDGGGENRGRFILHRTADQEAKPATHRFEKWTDFRTYILEEVANSSPRIFRGQWDGQKKLRTSFHRHRAMT